MDNLEEVVSVQTVEVLLYALFLVCPQKRHDLKSVQDMKSFVANDLKQLKSEHKSLTIREYRNLCSSEVQVSWG